MSSDAVVCTNPVSVVGKLPGRGDHLPLGWCNMVALGAMAVYMHMNVNPLVH